MICIDIIYYFYYFNDMMEAQIIKVLTRRVRNVIAIYIFGSFAANEMHKESDIDIAVLALDKLDNLQRWHISQELAVLLQQDVDLIDLKQASTVLRFQIISTGKKIYCSDPKKCDEFEDLTYSFYIRLNEERKEILDDIKKSGQVFHG